MIKPDTVSSFRTEDNKENAATGHTSSQKDAAIASTSSGIGGKKLSAKPSKTDQVLTYLKASVSTLAEKPHSFPLLCCFTSYAFHAGPPLQDKAAAELHNENRVYKKQLIGLLAR